MKEATEKSQNSLREANAEFSGFYEEDVDFGSLLLLAGHPSLRAVPPLGMLVTGWNGMYEFTVFLRLESNREIAETSR